MERLRQMVSGSWFPVLATTMALLVMVIFCCLQTATSQSEEDGNLGLPPLNTIMTATLSPPYSCRPKDEFNKGYENTALFLSKYSHGMNHPELLFNEFCGGDDYLESGGAGDDMRLIADLGSRRLETLTAEAVFTPPSAIAFDSYPKYSRRVKIQLNHTYAVVADGSDLRSLFVFTVSGYNPHEKIDLRYAVKLYQLMKITAQSAGWSWTGTNSGR